MICIYHVCFLHFGNCDHCIADICRIFCHSHTELSRAHEPVVSRIAKSAEACKADISCHHRLIKYCDLPSRYVFKGARARCASVTSIVTKCIEHRLFFQFKRDPEIGHRNCHIPVRMPPCSGIIIYRIGCRSFISASRILACCCCSCLCIVVISAVIRSVACRCVYTKVDRKCVSCTVVLRLDDQFCCVLIRRNICYRCIVCACILDRIDQDRLCVKVSVCQI